MSFFRIYFPPRIQRVLRGLPQAVREQVTLHLENLAALASSQSVAALHARLAEEDGQLRTEVAGACLLFSADPGLRLLYVHAVRPAARPSLQPAY